MKKYIEIAIHLIFWFFIFASVNVDWNEDWFDVRLRPNTPAPLSVLILPIYFYVNAFILIPKYFSKESWKKYVFFASLLFFGPEILRVIFYEMKFPERDIYAHLFHRDSFLFGAPSIFFIALNASFIYRLTKDWFSNKDKIQKLEQNQSKKKSNTPYEDSKLLNAAEIDILKKSILHQMEVEESFMNQDLTLRELAETVDSTEKKISYLLNQEMDTNFYEFINNYRVEKFKIEAVKPENKSLSMVGIAQNCGFPSKSSFYRAFKSHVGTSPSEYLKTHK